MTGPSHQRRGIRRCEQAESDTASPSVVPGVDTVADGHPTTRPRVSLDDETGDAYISLAEPGDDRVATSVPLWPVDDQPEALASLVLDFDGDGRLIGIKVHKPADRVLRGQLLHGIDCP